MPESVFGPIVFPSQVEKAVIATLKKWSPTYLREMERRTGRQPFALPDIASWRATDDILDRFPEQALPAVQLALTTDTELTTRATDIAGGFTGTIDVIVQSTEPEPARELASLYAFHLGLIILQNPGLDGSVKSLGTGWEKVSVPEVGKLKAESRWIAFGSATIIVGVEEMADPVMGPTEPDEGVPPLYPTVETHHTNVDLEA